MLIFTLADWRMIALRGVAAIAFGVLTLVWPGLTLWALVVLFGAYALVDGIFGLIEVARGAPGTHARRGWLIFDGLLGVAAGVITLAWPGITALALLLVIAFWAFFLGAIRLAAAIRFRDEIPHAWIPALSGALSIVFGALLVITPGAGALVITWLIGWFALLLGTVELVAAARVRSLTRIAETRISGMRSAAV
jgi:uncharacterized membrane protein HdeD (DUF308 family)